MIKQLKKHFFVVNQFFRIDECSHNVQQQQASISLTIVTHTDIAVGLDTVSMHRDTYCNHCQSCLGKLQSFVLRFYEGSSVTEVNDRYSSSSFQAVGQPQLGVLSIG